MTTLPHHGSRVRAEEVWHEFKDNVVLRGVSLDVEPGELVTLLGPSGSGKTTLLRIIAGLVEGTRGRIYIGDRDVTHSPAGKRQIGFVFQNFALFPHLNVFDNVAFALRLRHVRSNEVRQRVMQSLEMVDLRGLERRHVAKLSGGQQQRVALARAMVFNPAVLLMDEPLGSLDKRLRQQLQVEIRRLQSEVGITTIYVTHDQEEAFSISDRIAVMSDGLILQIDTPEMIYRVPADSFVAHFVGDINYFRGPVVLDTAEQASIRTQSGLQVHVDPGTSSSNGAELGYGIRPEHLRVGHGITAENRFTGFVRRVTFRGSHKWAEIQLASGDRLFASLAENSPVREGETVDVGWDVNDGRLFHTDED